MAFAFVFNPRMVFWYRFILNAIYQLLFREALICVRIFVNFVQEAGFCSLCS